MLSIWLLFDQALLFAAKGALNYQTGTYILLVTGALMTVIGFLGCCGALRESQCLLGTVTEPHSNQSINQSIQMLMEWIITNVIIGKW